MIYRLMVRFGVVLMALGSVQGLAADREDEVFVYAKELQAEHSHLCIAVGFIQGRRERVEHFGCKAADYFQIGSITKVFTTTALAASGKVDADTRLGEVFSNGLSEAMREITLGQLATHTSGLPRLPDNIDLSSLEDPYKDYGESALMDYLARYAPLSDEAAAFAYSNLGMGILGHALSEAEERTYARVIQDGVLSPLDLTDTWIDSNRAPTTGKVLQGHDAEGEPSTNWSFDVLAGAGALWSNLPDLMRFARVQLGDVPTPLNNAIAITHQSQAVAGPAMNVGLGWMISTREPSYRWHNGGTAGFRSWLSFSRDRNQAAVVLANGVLAEVDLMGQALMGVEVRLPALTRGLALSPDELEAYLGRYQIEPRTFLDVTLDEGDLYIQVSGQPRFKLVTIGEDQFRTELIAAEFQFSREKGRVAGVTIFQGGQEIEARRVGDVPSRPKLVLSLSQLDRLVGTYRIQPNFELEITRQDGSLFVQATGQPKFPLFAESEFRFYLEVVVADLEFKLEDGEVKGVWLHQNGKHYGKRIN